MLSDNGTTPDRLNGAKDLVASPDDAHLYIVAMDETGGGGGNAGNLTVLSRDAATGAIVWYAFRVLSRHDHRS